MLNKISRRFALNKYLDKKTNENLVGMFDTSIASLNVGDEIINESAREQLDEIFPNEQIVLLNTHDGISKVGTYRANLCKYRIVCGTNLLNGNALMRRQWQIKLVDLLRLKKIILMGVGWGSYNRDVTILSKISYGILLDDNFLHSVRDNYTLELLKKAGINNVINTGCPTLWKLNDSHCEMIPKNKNKNSVVITITDYNRDNLRDSNWIKIVCENYNNVHLWLQGSNDLEYFKSLGISNDIKSQIRIIPPKLKVFREILSEEIDFIGTRLHAGIKALQYKRRTLIIGIDNRALEKKKDFHLPVLDNLDELEMKINDRFDTNIVVPEQNIKIWKEQFSAVKFR